MKTFSTKIMTISEVMENHSDIVPYSILCAFNEFIDDSECNSYVKYILDGNYIIINNLHLVNLNDAYEDYTMAKEFFTSKEITLQAMSYLEILKEAKKRGFKYYGSGCYISRELCEESYSSHHDQSENWVIIGNMLLSIKKWGESTQYLY